MSRESWTRSQKLQVLSLVVAALGSGAALWGIPELRIRVGSLYESLTTRVSRGEPQELLDQSERETFRNPVVPNDEPIASKVPDNRPVPSVVKTTVQPSAQEKEQADLSKTEISAQDKELEAARSNNESTIIPFVSVAIVGFDCCHEGRSQVRCKFGIHNFGDSDIRVLIREIKSLSPEGVINIAFADRWRTSLDARVQSGSILGREILFRNIQEQIASVEFDLLANGTEEVIRIDKVRGRPECESR